MGDIVDQDQVNSYFDAFSKILEEIEARNEDLDQVVINNPRLNSKATESLVALRREIIFPNSSNIRNPESAHPDLEVKIEEEWFDVEVKATRANFQNIDSDLGCDYLVWLDFRKFFSGEEFINCYVLENKDDLEKYTQNRKEEGYKRPAHIVLSQFKDLTDRKVELEIT